VSFFGLLHECPNIGACLCFKIAIVNYILSRLVGDNSLHGVVEGWIMGGLIGWSEEGIVQSACIVQYGDGLFCWVDVITKLVNLKVAFGFVDIVSRVVVEGRPQRRLVELFAVIHASLTVIIKIIDLIG
jgi:hypothetical protein